MAPDEVKPVVVIFPSVLGVRAGVTKLADRLAAAGYEARVADLLDGRTFDEYPEAIAHTESIGFDRLIRTAVDAVADLEGPIVLAGFSAGGGAVEAVTIERGGRTGGVIGVLLYAAGEPMRWFEPATWPSVPVQVHYSVGDPFREDESVQQFLADVRASGVEPEAYLAYSGDGHLFSDPTLPTEYDAGSAELLYERTLSFLDRIAAD